MAPEVVLNVLPMHGAPLNVLDPMMGSGTTLVSARMKGHHAVGVDTDPLAVLLAKAATQDLNVDVFEREASTLLRNAKLIEKTLKDRDAYPPGADKETKQFVRYWFDRKARRQLAALVRAIEANSYKTKPFLMCAVSRMIITKQGGVSLAEDISHSRPHRTRDVAPTSPFELFPRSVRVVVRNTNFPGKSDFPTARVVEADCRALPFDDQSFDYVITSPPYLNAIDYLRGHKLSLVWFGHNVSSLRDLRATNVGSSRGLKNDLWDDIVKRSVRDEQISDSLRNRMRRYVSDLDDAIGEICRVLRPSGKAVFVIGDCNVRGVPVSNSLALEYVAQNNGLCLLHKVRRPLITSRRYLPPPTSSARRNALAKRMGDEVILTFVR